jgi:hypothetical protein
MKNVILAAAAVTMIACGPRAIHIPPSGGEAAGVLLPQDTGPSAAEMDVAYSSGTSLGARMAIVRSYVEHIEGRIPGVVTTDSSLTMVETYLTPDSFADVSEEEWGQMNSYYDGAVLKRIRMLPVSPETGTEEFYFNDGKLVYAFYDPNGANKADGKDENEAKGGERFFFGEEGLISWIKDGVAIDSSNPDFAYWSEQLLREADRFSRGTR